MQIEIYGLSANEKQISVELMAVCDSFSSLLWDVEFYQCGSFEVYIAANPQNVEVFQLGRIVGRDDDSEHFGIIESVKIETDSEDGDYLTVSGRFLTCLLERRIIYPSFSANNTYENVVRGVLSRNAISAGVRNIPGLSMGTISGMCWQGKTRLQVSYDNLMEWLYTICETIGGSINIRIDGNTLKCDLFEGTNRSILQSENPHIVFSDSYNNHFHFPMLRILPFRRILHIFSAVVKGVQENGLHIIILTQNLLTLTAMKFMWMSETLHRRKMSVMQNIWSY